MELTEFLTRVWLHLDFDNDDAYFFVKRSQEKKSQIKLEIFRVIVT